MNVDIAQETPIKDFENEGNSVGLTPHVEFHKYTCSVCHYVYEEVLGVPNSDIIAGTRWEQISEDWLCPECGATKNQFNFSE